MYNHTSIHRALGKFVLPAVLVAAIALPQASKSQTVEYIPYGNFNQWVTRNIKESAVIGGKQRTVYAVGPTQTIDGNIAYQNKGGSPWGSSNVYAKVAGVVKTSNAVYPHQRAAGDLCAKLATQFEHLKVLGMINMDVMVTGSLFLGEMHEPIASTSNPYSKLNMGMPYAKRPQYLIFDYKLDVPADNTRVKSTGFGSKKTMQGRDAASAFVLLQYRWEDADGNLHAKRVGTGGEIYSTATDWLNGHKIPIIYGDAASGSKYKWQKLLTGDDAYYGVNSKGKIVPIEEDGWDANATPTHVILMLSSGYDAPYVGTEGLTLYVDNVGFVF